MEKVSDPVVRSALKTLLIQGGAGCNGTRLIDELTVASVGGRIDVTVVGKELHGYEIKSDVDKLVRLPKEAENYAKVMDLLTLVVTTKHLEGAMAMVPYFWGVQVFEKDGHLRTIRKAKPHTRQELPAMVGLLWRPEALKLLAECGVTKGLKTKPKWALYEKLLSICTMDQVRAALVEQFKRYDDRR
jgi:hypothetical protein